MGVNRREFLQTGVAASVLMATGGVASAAANAEPRPSLIVIDERFPESVAFGRSREHRGAPLRMLERDRRGDITSLWYHDLYYRWEQGPMAMAGLTTAGSLFCLQLLAQDKGMRLVAREEQADGLVRWAIAPRRTNS